MPQVPINSSYINTFRFSVLFDLYNRQVVFDSSLSSYNGSSGSGIFSVAGISYSLIDSDNVELATIDFSDASKYIVPSVTNTLTLDLSSLPYQFLFQVYKIVGAIKDTLGNVYYTTPVYKKIGQPLNLNESGYVPGIFQVQANCVDNVLSIKELTVFTYCNLSSFSVTKTGVLYYPTGTIAQITFTGTPWSNNVIYTGQYRITCTSVADYDLGDDVFVDVTYLTNNVFDITCTNKIADLICCMVELQTTYLKNCNNAVGKNAQQQLTDVTVPFLLGLTKEINGQDASTEADLIRKTLKCDCGATSLRQNEFSPINPSVNNIVITGVGGTTVGSPTIVGNTKSYPIASNVYQVVKGNTGDLAFSIQIDTSTQYLVKYKITFDYEAMADAILSAISSDATLVAKLNSLIASTGNLDLTGLDGKCVIDLTTKNYFVTQNVTGSTAATKITINGTDHAINLFTSNTAGIQTLLNALSLGAFSVGLSSGVFSILSNGNTNTVNSITFSSPDLTVPFQNNSTTVLIVLQAIIDYLCNLTSLQSALGNTLTLWQLDYNMVPTSQGFTSLQSQAAFNQGLAESIYNIVQRISTLTAITCAKISAVFTDSSAVFGTSDRFYGTLGGSCASLTREQAALAVIAAIQGNSVVKAAFCAIDCAEPATCPDITDISLAVVGGTSIGVYALTWDATPIATQVVMVQYKLSSSGTWITSTSALNILPNGNISGTTPYSIPGLTAGQNYDVRIINNCGGVGFTKQIAIPSGAGYSGSFRRNSILYNLCGSSPVTLYSGAPVGTGVTMYTNVGLTVPLTGYTYIASSSGEIYTINPSTGVVTSDTGTNCNNGTPVYVVLGNNTGTICAGSLVTRYLNGLGSFIGQTLYVDAALTTPQTGYSYVLNTFNNNIYNLNSSTGVIGISGGLSCTSYSGTFHLGNTELAACGAVGTTLYSSAYYGVGVTMYTDVARTTPLTGYAFLVDAGGLGYNVDPSTGTIGSLTGNAC